MIKAQQLIVEFTVVFVLAFVVTAVVSFLYSQISHGSGVFDWELAFRNGLLLGIVFPLSGVIMKRRRKGDSE
jgi:hypothetical protein